MKKILISTLAVSALLFTVSCKTDFDTDVSQVVVSKGNADFSKYVAVGNSLTSGYSNGALYIDGQNESFPSMIAGQMKLAGGGDFKQPLMPNNSGGFSNLPGFSGKLVLSVVNGSLAPVPTAPGAALDNVTSGGPYQNMGVPGAKSFHLLFPGYGSAANLATGTANPYFVRFSSSTTASVIGDVMSQKPTFFSLWIGNNDVLGYATSGGDDSDPITPTATFNQAYGALVSTLTSQGAKGVVANIPNVTSLPFFTTVPYNPVPLDQASVTALNTQLFGPLKQILTAYGQGDRVNLLKLTNNPLLLKDESLTNLSAQITGALVSQGVPAQQAGLIGLLFGQARHATKADLIPLTTSSVIGSKPASPYAVAPFDKYGVTFPLEDKHVLRGKFGTGTDSEVDAVLAATATFNATIKAAADANNLAFVDANAKMIELAGASGIMFNGVKYTPTFVTGGTFSLDGVHLTGRGYGLIANEFLKQINAKYGSTLPMVDINKYSGVKFP
ncbi:GDSL-like Lipase/Acylhydrolase [Halpernia humi]|uniref:GDSL-like Lipase/Acylhydrolase n=1 Tax=Halpernia humi TaxID=493375 RepID=A0A1H5Y7U8_9FLAO|nr:G-D-S-L family lipolytic protein [Halpernia humi]SEG20044.1 GDSL-like Lipase/Acylhydrolase [Halpernia humi]